MSMDNAPCIATKEPVVLLSRLERFNKPDLRSGMQIRLAVRIHVVILVRL